MKAPQIIVIALMALELISAGFLDGLPRNNYSLKTKAIELAIWAALLTWGGFFQ